MSNPLENDVRQLHEAIGEAVSKWTFVEDSLAKVFATALRLHDHGPGWAAFYALINLTTKLDALDAALIVHCQGHDIYSEWPILAQSVRTKSKFRAKLAHYSLFQIPQARKGNMAVLAPSFYNPNYWGIGKSGPTFLTANNVLGAVPEFDELTMRISKFNDQLRALALRPPASYDMSNAILNLHIRPARPPKKP